MGDIVIPDEAIEAAGHIYGGQIPDSGLREILENAAPAILAANQAEAEKRGAVKALHLAANESDALGRPFSGHGLSGFARLIDSGEVTL